ncbi:MAG: TonB-dependent receptor plug domain-containing protein [Dysgonamonadaceae bacterium]|nr:TonB-dependent receptor plug domain-containing protein [Dysgonamonadaceae bacterium]MDD3901621.1 TonB-dependent receptor plug domain-containing protein [Dysgonamonadaceae bacterium]MDD4400075.1 TonB-dependent receptor plug domain-containing protein [Dysgonamonadaceae bacterium]
MQKLTFQLLAMLLFAITANAQNYTISGYITDEADGETLIGASVFDKISKKGNAANNFGYYSITLSKGDVLLEYSFVGYTHQLYDFVLQNDTVINVKLSSGQTLQEVTVVGNRSQTGAESTQMSAVEVSVEQIKNIPSIFGESDVIKALQLLPGVQGGTEGSAGMYVRGGGMDENLLLLDGVPVYNVNHMFGFFSVFNTDAVKNVTLYKGSFPARFGGRLSSVVDIRMKDGNEKKIQGSASIGLISSKFNIEGPIIKDRTTFNISARRTYIDVLARPFMNKYNKDQNEDNNYKENTIAGYYFYDLNAKFTHKINDRNRLYLSAYLGDDAVYTKMQTSDKSMQNQRVEDWTNLSWKWGNTITALRWNHVLTNKMFANTTLSYTRYRSNMGIGAESVYEYDSNPVNNYSENTQLDYRSGIEDLTARVDIDYTPNTQHDVKFGAGYTFHTFNPDVTRLKSKTTEQEIIQDTDTVIGSSKIYPKELSAYVEDNISIGRRIKFNAGLHFSHYSVQNTNYHSLEPRLGIRALINEDVSVKAGYAMMGQYIHMLSNSSISLPTDLWVSATKDIEPMRSHQYSAGVFWRWKDVADVSIEGYWKTMHNLIEYKDGASFMGFSSGWEEKVNMGDGKAYGVELLLQRSFGNTTGWIGYTWSKSTRLFDRPGQEINFGREFPAKYDRRHDVSITMSHIFSDRIDISGSWVYSTGNTGTLAMQYNKPLQGPQAEVASYDEYELPYINSRNNYRFNAYHRLDLGVNFHKKKRWGMRTWNISIYNVYNQLNPFMVYPSSEYSYNPETGESEGRNFLNQITLFPIIPSVSYTIKF